jgi:hypothetical protein
MTINHLFSSAAGIAIILAALVLLGAVAAAAKAARRKRSPPEGEWPLVGRPILTKREREWHQAILQACPEHHVFVQVALSQLIALEPGVARPTALRNHFQQLVADFVICKRDYDVMAVIEVDDPSHDRPSRREADERKQKAIECAGFKFMRIPARTRASEAAVRKLLGLPSSEIAEAKLA